jgi:hypothetical protein
MKNIYGTIGYTVLKNTNNNNKIIVLADSHNTLPNCTDPTNIAKWFKSKFNTSKILLEEVPRDGFKLEELWPGSPHTQELKNLFINNANIIQPVDIRPYLIPFSWELINEPNDDSNIILKQYIRDIDNFYSLKLSYFIDKLDNYKPNNLIHTKLGKHFIIIKKNYGNFLVNYKKYINLPIKKIYSKNPSVFYQINTILDEIMEWYICANIILNETKPIIIHAGLAHSEKIIRWLLIQYDYLILNRYGINSLDEIINKNTNISGCVQLPTDIDMQFGGVVNYTNH